ncbi:MAG: FAD-dependent oxidoreductase [Vulcanimicrobiota bacterium]
MNRDFQLQSALERQEPFDILIIGGGATGVGAAVDAASRGHSVLLLEGWDFGKGTSSRSTKLVHGGVRYLQKGDIPLVMDALKERGIMRRNAPHLVSDLAFVVPNYTWWEAPFYGIGMKVYDALAGRYGFGKSRLLTSEETVERIPTIATQGLRGGVQYYDGQFDDARMLVNMAQTAIDQGATLINYCRVKSLLQDAEGFTNGVLAEDLESGRQHSFQARIVLNCTGPFTDSVRRMDDPEALPVIAPSTGVHVVLPAEFLPRQTAIMVPRTTDGRVLFAIPWHHCVVVGTTDVPVSEVSLEPKPTKEEVEFILENARQYLEKPPEIKDVLSIFSGIRPLVQATGADSTAQLSRDHTILVSKSGLISIAGGKWTTYRHMAEDVIDRAETLGGLEDRDCVSKRLNIHGYHEHAEKFGELQHYGSDAREVRKLIEEDPDLVHPRLKLRRGEVRWMARHEMARSVDDVLSRRSRSLLFDAKAAREAAPTVASILREELNRDEDWRERQCRDFDELSRAYLVEELFH